MPALCLKLFGPFICRQASGAGIDLPTRRAEAIVAYLAVNAGREQARDVLATLLWEDKGEAQARANLRQTLSRLRRALPEPAADCLIVEPTRISLSPEAAEIDVVAFEALAKAGTPETLEQAAELYRGHLLEGFAGCGQAFEEWLSAERRRLEETALNVLERLLEHFLVTGAIDRAIQIALRLLALDPLQESVHRTLMQLYFQQDRIGAAHQQYALCRELLTRDLDVEPAPETERLHSEILRRLPANPVVNGDGPAPESPIQRKDELAGRTSIAVLPFTNMSGEPEQEHFSDGMTEDIITDLSRVSGFFIIARTSVFAYKGRTKTARQISLELGVRYILEGSVRKSGNQVRITAQLIDGRTGGHLWAERFDRNLEDVFHIQDEIAQSIVAATKVAIAPQERAVMHKAPTRNMEAYQFCLRGRQFLHEMTKKNLDLARQMFLKAIEIDKHYVQAYAGLADCGSTLCLFYDDDPVLLNDSLCYSHKALELDPALAEAHLSHGSVLMLMGEDAAARSEFETAMELDPMLYEAYWFMGRQYMNKGDLEGAAAMFNRASEVRGDDLQSMMMLTNSYDGLGRQAEAKASAERAYAIAERRLRNNPEDARAAYVGASSLLCLGDPERSLKWANLAAAIDSGDTRTNYNLACVYAGLGIKEKAFEQLELCVNGVRSSKCIEWVEIDPDLEALRGEPRFAKIMADWVKRDLQ